MKDETLTNTTIKAAIGQLQAVIHSNAVQKGWWTCQLCKGLGCTPCNFSGRGRNVGESLALIHSEVSEALEAKRTPAKDAHCDKCDGTGRLGAIAHLADCEKCKGNGKALGGSRFAEELADVVIRVLDLAGGEEIDLASAIMQKLAYNANRPHRHGKEF